MRWRCHALMVYLVVMYCVYSDEQILLLEVNTCSKMLLLVAFDEVMNLRTYIFCMRNATWTETFYLLDAFLKPNAFPLDAIPPFFKGGSISIRDKSLILMIVLCYPIPICAFWLITSYSWVKCYGHPRPTQLDVFIVIVVSSPPSATATIWDWCLCENLQIGFRVLCQHVHQWLRTVHWVL